MQRLTRLLGQPVVRHAHLSVAFLTVAFAGIGAWGAEVTDKVKLAPDPKTAGAGEQVAASMKPGEQRSLVLTPSSHDGASLYATISAQQSGIEFVNELDDENVWTGDYRSTLNGSIGSGTCIGDIDNDGWPDLYLVARDGRNRLYRRTEDFRFEDITDAAGVDGGDGRKTGAAMVDIDNDGDLDIYVCRLEQPNLLYLNQGHGKFRECAAERGLAFAGASVMATFSDYDRDGDLDMYLVTNRKFVSDDEMESAKKRLQARPNEISLKDGKVVIPAEFEELFYFLPKPSGPSEMGFNAIPSGQRDHLYANDGSGAFSDVKGSNLDGCYRGHCAVWWDYDGDRWPDLYVSNDFYDPDQLFRNNRDGTFTDVTREALSHTPWFSMGCDYADVNNDGRFDLMTTDMSATNHFKAKVNMGNMDDVGWFLESAEPRQYMRNALFLNTGTARFLECAFMAKVASSDWTWSTRFCDMDNDGWSDLFFATGMIRNVMDSDLQVRGARLGAQKNPQIMGELLRLSDPLREKTFAFRNRGGWEFENVSDAWGLGNEGISTSAAYGDMDRDGDMDLVVNNYNEPVAIYRNQGERGNGVLLRLVGNASNRFGVGAIVTAKSGAVTQTKCLTGTSGYMSSDEPLLHFGLGDQDEVSELQIEWPSGRSQTLRTLAANRFYVVAEPASSTDSPAESPANKTVFEEIAEPSGLTFKHVEKTFDDFRLQPLLPNRLSQLGPGMAWGDADGDGDDDVFLGGAAGQSGVLYLNQDGQGRFAEQPGPWHKDAACEDMAALWLDSDSDGDLDLFVVSGGVEAGANTELLRDRLYVNNGAQGFAKSEDLLPDLRHSGGSAAAGDFDRDGDLDIFVGGRVVPGKYPTSPESVLLRNDEGKFSDVTDQVAPELRRIGMVTGALWSDADADGYLDLLTTAEWGPVSLFHNEQGAGLTNLTSEAGLSSRTGWWNGITGGDLDGDGDIDYVVTNTGTNTKYHASAERPARVYYGVFDKSKGATVVEACFEGEHHYPVRGRSCSAAAMPMIAQKFPTFRSFAAAEIDDIFDAADLATAERFDANELRSLMLINQGDARFEARYLPTMAQISPGFGAAICDVDADGLSDIYLVQNTYSPQPETGRMDGGLSVLLKNFGKGEFVPQESATTGLLVPGDAKALALTDIDHNGRPDFAVTNNNSRPQLFQQRSPAPGAAFAVRLKGDKGNPSAIGAKLRLHDGKHGTQAAELYAGSGYLTQSAPIAFFARPTEGPATIEVQWPNGDVSKHAVPRDEQVVTLTKPQ